MCLAQKDDESHLKVMWTQCRQYPQPLSMKIILLVLHKCRCYVKGNLTKHIAPKLFYPHDLRKSGEVKIMHTKSCENLADLFTNSLPT